jgi:hypothetical protein
MKVAVGLLHYPIFDARKNIVATNITNLDIHDIARASRVYGVDRYYLSHPRQDQLMFVSRILEHWRIGDGAKFNPMRRTALTMVHTAESLDSALKDWGGEPELIGTHARKFEDVPMVAFKDLKAEIDRRRIQDEKSQLAADQAGIPPEDAEKRIFLLFGTGYGLTDDVMRRCSRLLEPIRGSSPDDYRHLSVRSAVSICLDRLLGS